MQGEDDFISQLNDALKATVGGRCDRILCGVEREYDNVEGVEN